MEFAASIIWHDECFITKNWNVVIEIIIERQLKILA